MAKKDLSSGKKGIILSSGGYYKTYIGSISVCGYERILVLGYETLKLAKQLHKRCLSGKITLSLSDEVEAKTAEKKYLMKPRVEVQTSSPQAMVNAKQAFDIIILHFNYEDLTIKEEFKLLKKLMNPTSTVYIREKFKPDALKSIEKSANKERLTLIKVKQTDTNLFGKVYDLKIRHK